MSTRYERIIFIDQQIRAGNFPSAKTIAPIFEVSERAIFDDRTFMIDRLRAPIETNHERGGWYYANHTWVLPAIWVNEDELLAFFLSHAVSKRYLGKFFEEQILTGWEKITNYLPDDIRAYLEEADRCYTIDPGFFSSISPDMLQDFELAIRKQRQVEMTYYTASRNEQRKRTVNPYHIYSAMGSWYLLAFDRWRQDIRTFNMERIEAYQLLDQPFDPDPNFSALPYLAQGFMGSLGPRFEVAIQFDAYQARYIRERQWHLTQSMEELPDGGVILRLQSGGLEAIQRWVMQYGSHAEVLEPAELRQAIAAEIKKMSQFYSD